MLKRVKAAAAAAKAKKQQAAADCPVIFEVLSCAKHFKYSSESGTEVRGHTEGRNYGSFVNHAEG